MKVSTTQPFQIIYALFEHEFLGFLFESFVVQLDDQGRLTLQHQNISSKNAPEFGAQLQTDDYTLIRLIDEMHQDVVAKKFAKKKSTTADFFLKTYDAAKGDKALQEVIDGYLESIRSQVLPMLAAKAVFEMGNDGDPTWKRLEVASEAATVRFVFRRNEENTHYFPMVSYGGQKLDFQYKNAMIVCRTPAWMLLGNRLHHFGADVDGNKLKPFLNKKFIIIPRKVEEVYFSKFVMPLIEAFDVRATGFEIRQQKLPGKPVVLFCAEGEENAPVHFYLVFRYGQHTFERLNGHPVSVSMEKTADSYVFHRVRRHREWEQSQRQMLVESGLPLDEQGQLEWSRGLAFDWLGHQADRFRELGFEVAQRGESKKRYFAGASSIRLEIRESQDWFDIHAVVRFGPYEVPFLKLRALILQKKREFKLPNGQFAVIPESWFTQYSELLAFTEESKTKELRLRKFHVALVKELASHHLAEVTISHKLEKLRDFELIEDQPLPTGFRGELRPYQKAGYNWMLFLHKFQFGGCLADDMGLGKTIQTLALLQHQKEAGEKRASLLVMPTSLIYNWEMEARKFTPQLRVLNYTGTHRDKSVSPFNDYDVVLTSYGIARLDVELLKTYSFNYVILDESQAIKNPASIIAKAVRKLSARHRLILTGTPLENSTMDLWSQLTFANPGLLGTQQFFRNEFLTPIEKRSDEAKKQKLYHIIKPFVLRRHKSQVARELPEKVDYVQYCDMTRAQAKRYEETKSFYRNKILDHIEQAGMAKSQLILLQGLTLLRQLANHPRLVDTTYEGSSGKLEDVLYKLESATEEGHKILVFSQFVKHLGVLRDHLDDVRMPYAYLDGSTRNRQEVVERFQQDDNIPLFLISLKAGGVGLNLTAADYVFILDPWWNPAIEAQAIDRAHRIGQDKKVFTYKFITRDSVEEKILKLQEGKQRLAQDLITTEETFVKNLSREDILSLLA